MELVLLLFFSYINAAATATVIAIAAAETTVAVFEELEL